MFSGYDGKAFFEASFLLSSECPGALPLYHEGFDVTYNSARLPISLHPSGVMETSKRTRGPEAVLKHRISQRFK